MIYFGFLGDELAFSLGVLDPLPVKPKVVEQEGAYSKD